MLDALWVPIDLSPELAVECLRETGFVFLFAPLYHPAMKTLGPLRRALGFRTILNLCGPLTNPAHARIQVVGVLAPSRVFAGGRALGCAGLRNRRLLSWHRWDRRTHYYWESVVARVKNRNRAPNLHSSLLALRRDDAGLPRSTPDRFTGGDIPTKALLYDVLTGVPGARRDIVLLNAAATLVAAGLAGDLKEGVALGAEAIDSGQAAATLAKLRQFREKYAARP